MIVLKLVWKIIDTITEFFFLENFVRKNFIMIKNKFFEMVLRRKCKEMFHKEQKEM